jgi:hypothetical protein
MQNDQIKKDLERHSQLVSERQPYEQTWQECYDYILPRKAEVTTRTTPGAKRNYADLYDSTGMQGAQLLAATLASGLTNPQTVWFHLTTGDEAIDRDDEVRHWMATTHHAMHNVINNSNYHNEKHENYLDLATIGNGPLSIEEDDEFVVRFNARHIRECYIDEDHRGMVDTVHRVYCYSARHLVGAFGEKAVGKVVLKMIADGDQTKLEVLHIVEPRAAKEKGGPKNYPIASRYILKQEGTLLSEGGYREMPYIFSRWQKASSEKYGHGPGQVALADIKMLNAMKKATIQGAQMTIRPPLVVPHDGYLLPVRLTPGGTTYAKQGAGEIRPLITNARIDFGIEMIKLVQSSIMEAFYVNRFELPNGPMMTATEVQQRTNIMYRYMGPMLANLQHQDLRPTIDRVFGIMMRKGLIARPPEAIQGKNIGVKYSSPVAKAQQAQDGEKLLQAIQASAPFVQIDPNVIDNFNGDEAIRYIAGVYGVPESVLRDQREVKKIRAARAEQQAKQQKMAEDQMMAQNIQAAGPTVMQAMEAEGA